MNLRTPTAKKWLLRAVKLLILVLVVWAVRRTLYNAWNQLGEYPWQLRPGWLVVSGCLYVLGLLPAGLFWHRVLLTLGQGARLGETLRAYYIGHLGKYVPGKAIVVVLRTGMIRSQRVNTAVAAVSVFFETLTMMAVGAFLAAAILAVGYSDRSLTFYGAMGLMIVAGLPTLPPIFRRLVRLVGVGKSDPAIAEKIGRLGYGTLLAGWLLMILAWGLLGLSYWATLRAMGVSGLHPIIDLPRYTASVSLAMVAGFLLLVLPGGLGVREAALVKIMIPYLARLVPHAELVAWTSAALLRLVWVASELAVSGLTYFLRKRESQPLDRPTEICRADTRLRRRVAWWAGCASMGGLIGLAILHTYLKSIDSLKNQDLQAALAEAARLATIIAWITGVSSVLAGAWLLRLGLRTRRSDRFPPPGTKVIRDTAVRTGADARAIGNLALAGGVLVAVAGTAAAWYLGRLAVAALGQ